MVKAIKIWEVSYANTVKLFWSNKYLLFLADHFECETGWTKHGTHCFKVFTEKVKHAEAQNICRSNKATLAVPHEDRTLQFLSDIVYLKNTTDHSNNHFFWIGLFVENHITLKTSDGTNANHYRWLPLGHSNILRLRYQNSSYI